MRATYIAERGRVMKQSEPLQWRAAISHVVDNDFIGRGRHACNVMDP